jgi:hypothetical protein
MLFPFALYATVPSLINSIPTPSFSKFMLVAGHLGPTTSNLHYELALLHTSGVGTSKQSQTLSISLRQFETSALRFHDF